MRLRSTIGHCTAGLSPPALVFFPGMNLRHLLRQGTELAFEWYFLRQANSRLGKVVQPFEMVAESQRSGHDQTCSSDADHFIVRSRVL